MKKIIIFGLLLIIVFFVLKHFVYQPYAWKKAMQSKEHKLQIGSFIFNKVWGSNGSQSPEKYYYVYKVTEINGDFVRLSVIRKLGASDGDFSTTSDHYNKLKETINQITITPILKEDLYKGDGFDNKVNSYLLKKYPALGQSRYYYENTPIEEKNKPLPGEPDHYDYFSMVYSKKEIIENGQLVPWGFNNSTTLELFYYIKKDIDVIIN